MMYRKIINITFFLVCIIIQVNCAGSGGSGIFAAPNQIAVDSTNNRLFIAQSTQELFALIASTLNSIGDQPIVKEDRNEAIFALLPSVVTNLGVFSTGSTSRLFIMGAFLNDSGNTVLNRIRVLDFNGTDFSEASFSPIDLSDGDSSTDETDNSFSDLVIDQGNSLIYVTDTSAGMLYVLSASDGSTTTGPLAISGNPQGMSLDSGRLYVCNSSSTDVDQVITVFDVSDFSSTTIVLDVPCEIIAVQSNSSGTVLMVKRYDTQVVLIRSVDTSTFADSSPIPTSTSGINDGQLTSGLGITSSIAGIVLTKDSNGLIYAYLSELDGNIQYLIFQSDLSSFSLETLSTSVTNITKGSLLLDSSDNGSTAFLVAESGALISIEVGTTSVDVEN